MDEYEDDYLPQYPFDESYDLEEFLQARVEYHDFKEEWYNLVQNCMSSVFLQSLDQLKTLLLCSFMFRIVSRFVNVFFSTHDVSKKLSFLYVCGILLGLVSLRSINESNFETIICVMFLYILITFLIFSVLARIKVTCGKAISVFTVAYLIGGELLINDSQQWHQVRGILLLLSMKAISVAFDLDSKRILKAPSFLSYVAYCLHCGTLLFGPWVSFEDFVTSLANAKPLSFGWLINVVKSLIFTFLCLLLSTCVFSYLFIDGAEPYLPAITPFVANYWMASYQSALAFHFSHFYICYLAQGICMLSGIGQKSNNNANNDVTWSDFKITRPLNVEFPTSMLNVVVAWNIPMSNWLKYYVFNAYKHLGSSTAILLTYAASAMLHGLSFHLAAVLLSLAFYTYVEYSLRKKFSKILNCEYIQARPKIPETGTKTPLWAYIFNFVWVTINLMHLAYLGAMFQSEDESTEQEGYPMKHTLEKWRNLGFFSHGFAIGCFVLNLLIPA